MVLQLGDERHDSWPRLVQLDNKRHGSGLD